MKAVACAIALHPDGAPLRLALPEGGTLPPMRPFEQDAAPTAAQELFRALGLETRNAVTIGSASDVLKGSTVHFVLCRVPPPVRDRWKHARPDGTAITARWVHFDDLPPNAVLDWIRAAL